MTPLRMSYRQRGVGLVELMISLVLGLLVSAMAIQMFLGSRSSLTNQDALAYLQESARYVSYRLQPLMRNLGYAGCANVGEVITAPGVDTLYDLQTPLTARTKSVGGLTYTELTLAYADKESEARLAGGMSSTQGDLAFPSGELDVFLDEDRSIIEFTALINDCKTADIFTFDKTQTVSGDSLASENSPSRVYGNAGSAISYVYPVKAWRLLLDKPQGSKSHVLLLDRIGTVNDFDPAPVTLVDGVAGFRVTFGVDTNGDGSIDRLDATPTEMDNNGWWQALRRLDIALTLQTEPGIVPGGDNDGRLRRTFHMSFTPRNLQLRGES
ncbi:prepilin-type N-terminal cleavage/methylation domain-containing protein [Pistricoccus aurantiacus]|uniref:prepilin-type N-terminal cleavage/methylation domain-containing protein n=1 Tax=Pistricoccus aurantiacus TaxID=1883414 RepID=UPI003634C914